MGKKYTADTFEGAVTGTASGNVAKTGDTMTGNLTISKATPALILNTSPGPYLNSKIRFNTGGGTPLELFEILGQSNPAFNGLAFRAWNGTLMADSFIVHSDYNYTPLPLRVGTNASANELDDFEEGDANLEFGLASYSPGSTITYYGSGDFGGWINRSKYIKVGSSVTVYIDITFSNASTQPPGWLSSMASTWLGGLPFSVAGSFTSDYNSTSPLHGDYSFGLNLQSFDSDNGFQIRPYKWGTYGMYFGFTRAAAGITPIYNNVFNYTIGSSDYGARQITGVIHYRTTQ